MSEREELFNKFIKFFWLRPENALMTSIRSQKYSSTSNLLGEMNMDISCGDGVFTFLTMGGELCDESDMFRSVNISESREGNFDTFDYFDESYSISKLKDPNHKIHIGSDWKNNLLKKAEKLNFYNKLILHDNNDPLNLPNESLDYVYSNSAYWVRNFNEHILDMLRLTKSGGHVVLELKTSEIINQSSYKYAPFMGDDFNKIIDAGRLSTWGGLKSLSEYDQIFSKLDIEIVRREPIYGGMLAKIWDIGMRPIYNPLVKLSQNVNPEIRKEVKAEWCEIFMNLFGTYISEYQADEESAIEWLFVLRKK